MLRNRDKLKISQHLRHLGDDGKDPDILVPLVVDTAGNISASLAILSLNCKACAKTTRSDTSCSKTFQFHLPVLTRKCSLSTLLHSRLSITNSKLKNRGLDYVYNECFNLILIISLS
jgi:hypothetical protein